MTTRGEMRLEKMVRARRDGSTGEFSAGEVRVEGRGGRGDAQRGQRRGKFRQQASVGISYTPGAPPVRVMQPLMTVPAKKGTIHTRSERAVSNAAGRQCSMTLACHGKGVPAPA